MIKYPTMNVDAPARISLFRDKYAFLSNFYPAAISYRDYQYANNEAAFQAQKAVSFMDQQKFCITRVTKPADAKRLGRKTSLRPDWDHVKIQLMYEI